MKGHSSGNNGSRGRPYGVILILAFGAAILGVLLLHKLREKRIFNLLVKDKDRQLISLHLLLQKEREYSKEVKRKNEEMKAKLYSCRMQKRELDNEILEIRSTISSLRDERRAIEVALEERQNEIKLLEEKEAELNKENPQVVALKEILKQKEYEMEDLKHRVEFPVKVWSVSTDDPSKPSVNSTVVEASMIKEQGNENESTNYRDGDKVRGEDRKENEVGFSDRTGMNGEGSRKMESSQDEEINNGNNGGEKAIDEVEVKKIDTSHDGEILGIGESENKVNATEITRNEDSDVKILNSKEDGSGEIEKHEKVLTSQGGEDWRNGEKFRGGMKLEMREKSQRGSRYRMREKHGYVGRTKGQRSRVLAKTNSSERDGNFGNKGQLYMRSGRVFEDGMENRRNEEQRNGEIEKMDEHRDHIVGENHLGDHHNQEGESFERKIDDLVENSEEVRKTVTATENFKDAENVSIGVENIHSDQQVEKAKEMYVQKENTMQPMNGTIVSQTEEKGSGFLRQRRSENKVDIDSEKYGEPEDLNVADVGEAEREILRDSTSELKEDKEEYNEEEADEPEF